MSVADLFIGQVDRALRTLSGTAPARRDNPARSPAAALAPEQRRHAAGLMRVNHSGEVCAQALYEGQALTARDPATREALQHAAQEEIDHLAWCSERLAELDSRPSRLNPLFYGLSYAMGAATGLLGDRVSLGFVEATEDQVCRHLESHLERLPPEDARSREIIERMHSDEAEHGAAALERGGSPFPEPIRQAMTVLSRVMTETTYRF